MNDEKKGLVLNGDNVLKSMDNLCSNFSKVRVLEKEISQNKIVSLLDELKVDGTSEEYKRKCIDSINLHSRLDHINNKNIMVATVVTIGILAFLITHSINKSEGYRLNLL